MIVDYLKLKRNLEIVQKQVKNRKQKVKEHLRMSEAIDKEKG